MKKLYRVISKLLLVCSVFICIVIAWLNIRFYNSYTNIKSGKTQIIKQLNFLEFELKNNSLGDRMQQLYPEGKVFVNALYGLTWCELALQDSSLKNKAIKEALFSYNQISDKATQLNFDKSLLPEHGVYYFGWKNYLLSKIFQLDTTFHGSDILISQFKYDCKQFIEQISIEERPYLESYIGLTWPADMVVSMVAVSNSNKLFSLGYEQIIKQWIEKTKLNLDPNTGLVPHCVDSKTNKMMEGARGSSSSLILRLLHEIDPSYSNELYPSYKNHLHSSFFGVPFIREYPKGQNGIGDIDSGPVIFGIGFAGTIVSIGSYSLHNDADLSRYQYNIIHTFGFTTETENSLRYLYGELPMADAFIAWSASSINSMRGLKKDTYNYPMSFHCVSISLVVLIFILSLIVYRKIHN